MVMTNPSVAPTSNPARTSDTAPTGPGSGAGSAPLSTAISARGRRLPPNVALYVLASITISFLAASSAPTPLYAVYQAEWGFDPITTTVVFGVYAVAVLLGLLTMGKLSDHVGRRPVLLAALAAQAASMIVFATADGVPALMVARIVQGLSTGAALGAIGAGMMDIDRERGTITNAVAPGIGTATGALVSGLVVQFLPAPTHLVYLGLLAVFVVQAVAVALMAETVTRKPGALASLAPEIKLPRAVRRPMLVAAPVLFAVWALAGLYGSLGPSLARQLTGSGSEVLGGLSLFVLAGVAAVSVLVLRRAATRTVMLTGILALIAGVALTLASIRGSSPTGFFMRHRPRGRRLRQRVPGRHPYGHAAGPAAREFRGAVAALRRLLPGHGRARRDRRVPRGPRGRTGRHRAGVRRRRDRPRGVRSARTGARRPGRGGGPAGRADRRQHLRAASGRGIM